MKIGIITDIHYGRDGYFGNALRRIFRDTDSLLERFVREMNDRIKPDVVVQLGDLIEDTDPDTDRKNLERVAKYFRSLHAPVAHVLGNHDRRDLSLCDFKAVLGHDCCPTSLALGEIDLVFLESDIDNSIPFFTDAALSLLQNQTLTNKRPQIVFSHHPLADFCLDGNKNWGPANSSKAFPTNRAAAHSLISESSNVLLCVNGHLHANYHYKQGSTQFITVQSLVDNFREDGTPAAAYGVLEIRPLQSLLQVFGNDPASFEIPRGWSN